MFIFIVKSKENKSGAKHIQKQVDETCDLGLEITYKRKDHLCDCNELVNEIVKIVLQKILSNLFR
jgi:hypothetical protein